MSGTVYLVGAGCGNPDLITWKGLRLLRACDAVFYDDLSSPKLLEETRTDCERLFVGKRYGRHSMPQAEINALLVAKAQATPSCLAEGARRCLPCRRQASRMRWFRA